MIGSKPGGGVGGGLRARPMGGFNSNLGGFNEHLDEAAMQAASKQKQLATQQSSTASASGKSGSNPLAAQTTTQAPAQTPSSEGKGTFQPQKPREVGSLKDELVKRPLHDIKKGVLSIFDLKALLNINLADTPEEQTRKKSLHQRFQKLTEEQQQVAQKQYRETMQKKKLEQEEKERKKQAEKEKQANTLAAPSSPKKGPLGPASGQSKKQKTSTMLQQSRQGLSQVGNKF